MLKKILLLLPLLLFCALSGHAQCASQTPNVGLQIPAIGNTTVWGICEQNNLATLDLLLGGTSALPTGTTPLLNIVGTNFITANTTSTAITNILSGFPGQLVRLVCGSGDTFTSIAPSSTFIINGSWACPAGSTISLLNVSGVWYEVSRYIPPIVLVGTLTTTSATSDAVSITGIVSTSHCWVQPTNASAATNIATEYVTVSTGSVTVHHATTASMTFFVMCTPY